MYTQVEALIRRRLPLAFVLIASSAAAGMARAQAVDLEVTPPEPSSRTTNITGFIGGGIAPITDNTKLIFGGLYGDSSGTDLAGGFAIFNTKLSDAWTLVAGYILVEPQVSSGPKPHNHNFRFGATYSYTWDRITFDNRALYEAVITDQGRENGNRLRNRARLTYQLFPENDLKPRLFGYVEPIYDDRYDAIQTTNYTAGIGISMGSVDIDLYYSRLEREKEAGGDINGLTLQVFQNF